MLRLFSLQSHEAICWCFLLSQSLGVNFIIRSMATANVTGYGAQSKHRLEFTGDNYELWEVKFMGHLRIKKLHTVVTDTEPSQDGEGAETARRRWTDKNEEIFAELVQYLDDRSLSLIIRDAKDDGRKALKILRDHYMGTSKPRIIALYQELTSLRKSSEESMTDYVIRAETAAASLKTAGKEIDDTLLVAMVLKGLPSDYKTFATVISQKDTEVSFPDFKIQLKSYEETQNSLQSDTSDDVMKVKNKIIKCYKCNKPGHFKSQCKSKISNNKRWCSHCKSSTHDTNYCRKINSAQITTDGSKPTVNDEHTFAFRVTDTPQNSIDFIAESFLVDCGASIHIVSDSSKFLRFDKNFDHKNHVIQLADGSQQSGIVIGKGDASVQFNDKNGATHNVRLTNCLCIPSYKQNIFSVAAATASGASVQFSPDSPELTIGDTVFNIKNHGNLYYLIIVMNNKVVKHSAERWHNILGHCNMNDILKLEGVVDGMQIVNKTKFSNYCDTCSTGKMTQFRNRTPDERAKAILELMHCDVAGPIEPVARDGFRYALSFIDDFSGLNMTYLLKAKSDTFTATQKFIADCAPFGKIKRLRCDNGGEFTSNEFKNFLIKKEIKQEFSSPHSAHQNGTAERSWRTIFDMARCLLINSEVPKSLWTYAVKCAVYIRNRCFNLRTGKTPFEVFTGKKPNLSNMHVFGSKCHAYIQIKKKLDPRSEKGTFIGYGTQSPAYLTYFSQQTEVRRVRLVKFSDDVGDLHQNHTSINDERDICYQSPQQDLPTQTAREPNLTQISDGQPLQSGEIDQAATPDTSDGARNQQQVLNKSRYPNRTHKQPKYLDDYITGDDMSSTDISNVTNFSVDYIYRVSNIPKNYQDAIHSNEASKWLVAMNDEITSLKDNDTFELVPSAPDMKVLGGRWVYAVKYGPDNSEHFKARYVAKGYDQVKDIDYQETFSPTARLASIRMLLQHAVQDDLIVHQLDVKTAYLNADIDRNVYIDQPEGYVITDFNNQPLICKLKKSLYGLKQSGRLWNNMLHKFLLSIDFKQSSAGTCVYTKFNNGNKIIIIIWVDDIVVAASNIDVLNEIKTALCDKFKMKDLNQLSWFLGMEFKLENSCATMNQHKYLDKLLEKFNLKDCHSKIIPCDMSINSIIANDSQQPCDDKLYREIVGSLIYLMTGTRPDLSFVVTKLSQHMSKPTETLLGLAKGVLRYVKCTKEYDLKFCKCKVPLQLIGHCDSDWGASDD